MDVQQHFVFVLFCTSCACVTSPCASRLVHSITGHLRVSAVVARTLDGNRAKQHMSHLRCLPIGAHFTTVGASTCDQHAID